VGERRAELVEQAVGALLATAAIVEIVEEHRLLGEDEAYAFASGFISTVASETEMRVSPLCMS
jgi:hypothetical protein